MLGKIISTHIYFFFLVFVRMRAFNVPVIGGSTECIVLLTVGLVANGTFS